MFNFHMKKINKIMMTNNKLIHNNLNKICKFKKINLMINKKNEIQKKINSKSLMNKNF